MGFVLSVLYFLAYYLGPELMFGPLANYRIELILAILILIVSLPKLQVSFVFGTSQAAGLIGLAFVVFLSILFASHWLGGAVQAFFLFTPSIYAYFLFCLHFDTKKRLQAVVLMLLFVCVFDIANGAIELHRASSEGGPTASGVTGKAALQLWDLDHPYLLSMGDQGDLYRIRGLKNIHDPNDFGQLLVMVIPLLFVFWRPNKVVSNLICVALPSVVLVFGIYLTHSRGALVALAAVVLFAMRRRFGTVPAVLTTVGLFFAGMALNFTGGRGISADSGSDRTALWSQGMTLVKEHPIFGVGFNHFGDYAINTAHNSVVVCAAELGIVGLFFWCLFLMPTMWDALLISSPKKVAEAVPEVAEKNTYSTSAARKAYLMQPPAKLEVVDKAEVNRIAWSIALSLIGFLAAGWFLSRAFTMSFFLLGGMCEAVFEMARRRGMVGSRLPFLRSIKYSTVLMVSFLVLLDIMLRFANLSR